MNENLQQDRRARVFISCGQKKGTSEEEATIKIAKKLVDLGFNPYIAIEETTLLVSDGKYLPATNSFRIFRVY